MKVLISQRVASRLTGFSKPTRCENLAVLGLLVLALFLCGCSSFERNWRKAAKQPAPADSMAGRWEGRWISDVNGHAGNLRCLITGETNATCQARFRATYGKLLRFTYTVPMNLQKHFDGWEFDGQENLGRLAGGIYYYEGRASRTNFFSTYRSKYDHGVFEMRRPE